MLFIQLAAFTALVVQFQVLRLSWRHSWSSVPYSPLIPSPPRSLAIVPSLANEGTMARLRGDSGAARRTVWQTARAGGCLVVPIGGRCLPGRSSTEPALPMQFLGGPPTPSQPSFGHRPVQRPNAGIDEGSYYPIVRRKSERSSCY